MDVSDRRMQVQLTQEAKIASDLILIGAIFAVVGFVSALNPRLERGLLIAMPRIVKPFSNKRATSRKKPAAKSAKSCFAQPLGKLAHVPAIQSA